MASINTYGLQDKWGGMSGISPCSHCKWSQPDQVTISEQICILSQVQVNGFLPPTQQQPVFAPRKGQHKWTSNCLVACWGSGSVASPSTTVLPSHSLLAAASCQDLSRYSLGDNEPTVSPYHSLWCHHQPTILLSNLTHLVPCTQRRESMIDIFSNDKVDSEHQFSTLWNCSNPRIIQWCNTTPMLSLDTFRSPMDPQGQSSEVRVQFHGSRSRELGLVRVLYMNMVCFVSCHCCMLTMNREFVSKLKRTGAATSIQ